MPKGTRSAPNALSIEIARTLRAQKAVEKITDLQLAEATGISRPAVNKIVNGNQQADIEQIDMLCFALGLNFTKTVEEAALRAERRYLESDNYTALVKV